jgi:hypothetical protein
VLLSAVAEASPPDAAPAVASESPFVAAVARASASPPVVAPDVAFAVALSAVAVEVASPLVLAAAVVVAVPPLLAVEPAVASPLSAPNADESAVELSPLALEVAVASPRLLEVASELATAPVPSALEVASEVPLLSTANAVAAPPLLALVVASEFSGPVETATEMARLSTPSVPDPFALAIAEASPSLEAAAMAAASPWKELFEVAMALLPSPVAAASEVAVESVPVA